MTTPDDNSTSNDGGIAERRISSELRAAAREISLTPGSECRAVTTGRRRRHRRRRATTFALVTALGAGTAFGVQQLARTGDERVATDDPETTTDTTTPDGATGPSPSLPTSGDVAAETMAPAAAVENDEIALAGIVESNIVWNVVEVDSAEAVSFAQVLSGSDEMPGLALSSTPGRSNDGTQALWRTEDGITWQQVAVDVPVGRLDMAVFDGLSVYAVGTAPGIAATEPNPLVFASSPDGGVTWDQIELPLDTNAARSLPLVRSVDVGVVSVPIDGGALVVVSQYIDLDWEALLRDAGIEGGWSRATNADGLQVIDSAQCEGQSQLVELGVTVTTAPYPGTPTGPCEPKTITWDALGVPDETRAFLDGQFTGYRVVGGEVTEVDVPNAYYNGSIDGRAMFSDNAGRWYEVTADGELVDSSWPSSEPLSATADRAYPVGERGGVRYASSSEGTAFGGWRPLFGSTDGATWTWADWSQLYGLDMIASRMVVGVTAAGLTSAVAVTPDSLAAGGGAEISTQGITISRRSQMAEPEFSYTETGEPIALSAVRQDAMTGDVVILDADGGEAARLRSDVIGPVLWGGSGGGTQEATWYVETSADGTNVAVESLAELLGVDDADISSVPRISSDGTNTIIAVTMTERDDEGVPKQLVLVGTPRG